MFFTLRTYASGKVISSVVVVVVAGTKINKSRKIDVGQSALGHQMVKSHEHYPMLASNHLGWPTSSTNRAFSPATPIDHTFQCHVSTAHAQSQKGKGRWIINAYHRVYCTVPRAPG